MEIRSWAIHILSADRLEDKLLSPTILTDNTPGTPLIWQEPTRPPDLQFQKYKRNQKLPSLPELGHPDKRALCLHRFAGHELLAVEIMAFTLLAFPDAPSLFRKGVARTLKEEQGHVRLYLQQLQSMGVSLGDLPLFRHFWSYTPYIRSPIEYVSLMSLTFENANLDFAPIYGAAFESHGDFAAAKLMGKILKDEIRHVAFGWQWLSTVEPDPYKNWDLWMKNLPPKMTPVRAKGKHFFPAHRKAAGIHDEWIINLQNFTKTIPEC